LVTVEQTNEVIDWPAGNAALLKLAPLVVVDTNVASVGVLLPPLDAAARPAQKLTEGQLSEYKVPSDVGKGSMVNEWPPFDVEMYAGWLSYVAPAAQFSASAQASVVVKSTPVGTGKTLQLRAPSRET
jgi:hypothetical protein